MSEIFYSQVDTNLQQELNARAIAGRSDRSTKSLNFMLGKIANVELIAYQSEGRDTELHRLGGSIVRSGEYLPTGNTNEPGFLDNREKTKQEYSWDSDPNTGEIYTTKTETTYQNRSKRIPPYITSTDVNIGDHSYGLMNKATINITIPNPEADLDFFESVWLRPGRHIVVKIAYPDSANITKLPLTSSLPSTETIKNLNPSLSDDYINKLRKTNEYEFYGLLTNFSFTYNPDASVSATLNLTGTSTVYTDVTLLMNPSKEPESEIPLILGKSGFTEVDQLNLDNSNSFFNIAEDANSFFSSGFDNASISTTNTILEIEQPIPILEILPEGGVIEERPPLPVYDDLDAEINREIKRVKNKKAAITTPIALPKENNDKLWLIDGEPFDSGSIQSETYITLSWIVDYMNRVIIKKRANSDPEASENFKQNVKIICNDTITTGTRYTSITSADPFNVILWDTNKQLTTYGELIWYNTITRPDVPNFQDDTQSYPSRIFINTEFIYQTLKTLSDKKRYEFNVNNFFKRISSLISSATGNAINLSFITHPELENTLLFYDTDRVRTKENLAVIPYSIPMFANNVFGTIVQDFKFNAKIPDSVKNLSYVLHQNEDELSEEQIAPYMNFMYNSANVTRTTETDTDSGITTRIESTNPNAEQLLNKLKSNYKAKHEKYVRQLTQCKVEFGENPTSDEKRRQLKQALIRYIQYPTGVLTESNQLTAPIYPFDAEFTTDGINGFRYGDVLQFDGLPKRYIDSTVFSIININHTVSTNGEWKTNIKCIQRPKFE